MDVGEASVKVKAVVKVTERVGVRWAKPCEC